MWHGWWLTDEAGKRSDRNFETWKRKINKSVKKAGLRKWKNAMATKETLEM